MLGLRSPIIDVEHQQLFSPRSVEELLRRGNFERIGRRGIRNRYPLRYWVRLLPLPAGISERLDRGLGRTALGRRAVSLNVGNIVAWGFKPAAPPAGPAAAATEPPAEAPRPAAG